MLDGSSRTIRDDYIAGFPVASAPRLRDRDLHARRPHAHQDGLGNTGDSRARRRAVDDRRRAASSIPRCRSRSEGRMRGFQLWLNLPAKEKMKPRGVPRHRRERDSRGVQRTARKVKVIAGSPRRHRRRDPRREHRPALLRRASRSGRGVRRRRCPRATTRSSTSTKAKRWSGEERKPLAHRAAGLLSDGNQVRIGADASGARVLLLAGKPMREPVVQYGPFVMNSRQEIEQAIADYQAGTLSRGEIGRIKIA